MPGAAECIAAISQASEGRLSEEEIVELAEEIERIYRTKGEDAAFQRAEEIGEDVRAAAAQQDRNHQKNLIIREQLMARMDLAYQETGDARLGLRAAMVGVNTPFRGSRDSVDARAEGIMRGAMGQLVNDLQRENLLGVYRSGDLDREINRELWDLSLKEPTGIATTSKQAKQIAKILARIQEELRTRENKAGALIGKLEGRSVRTTHNRAKMIKADRAPWAAKVSPLLDWDRMNIPLEERADFLDSVWEALTTGVRKEQRPELRGEAESDALFEFKGPRNLAKKESAHRLLQFKNADGWFEYNEAFGMGNLREGFQADVSRASRNTALMQNFGTNPEAMFNAVRKRYARKIRSDDPKMAKRMDKSLVMDAEWAEISGTVNAAQWESLAQAGRVSRAWISMAKLGGAVISAVSDLGFVAAERRYQGRNLMDMWGDAFIAPLQGALAGDDLRRASDLLGVGIDGMTGGMVSRFAAQDDVPGRTAKLMDLFFRLNLLTQWTDSVKRGFGLMMSHDLATRGDMPIDQIDDNLGRILQAHDFSAREWEVARGAIRDVDGRRLMLADEVMNVGGAAMTGLNKAQQDALRDTVRRKLISLVNDRADFASPTPGARERALIRLGVQPGTVHGEALRFMMQFKSFPITASTKFAGRALSGGRVDVPGVASSIAGLTVLGFLALQLKEMAKGREPRPNDLNTWKAAFLQGGGAGIYGDFFFGEFNRFGNSAVISMLGPGISEADNIAKMFAKAREGEDITADIVRFGKNNTPFINLFYTRAALDYLILYQLQEWANPGYLRRMERRLERDQGQRYLVPPSRAIPRGGGDRIFEGVR